MKNKAFTLIELLIVTIILSIVLALIAATIGKIRYNSTSTEDIIKVLRKYEIHANDQTEFRVDFKKENSPIATAVVINDFSLGRYDADMVYADLEEGRWYKVKMVGTRNVYLGFFPNILTSKLIDNLENQ